MAFTFKDLDTSTWDAFTELVERNNGIFGGCWCTGFHAEGAERGIDRRAVKEERVRAGRAHAALVLDEEGRAQGWCQWGSTEELPNIKHRRVYLQGFTDPPDWRITCFFVDKAYRGRGVAATALGGALQQIAGLGGGTVESYPERVEDRSASSSFLHNGTVAMFERQGFERTRPIGKHHWVVTRSVAAD